MFTALSWLIVWARALMAEDLASLNIRSISTGPSPAFCAAAGPAAKDCLGGGFGIEAVGLALAAAGGLVGLVDLDDLDAGRAQVPRHAAP
jgi:hypothetical protein